MKKNNKYNKVLAGVTSFLLLLTSYLFTACTVDDVKPQGTLDQETAYSSPDSWLPQHTPNWATTGIPIRLISGLTAI